jgi:hypothetical protein
MGANSIFRPYGPGGSESIQCRDPKCQALNPPEAKFCWICAKRLVPNEVSFGAYDLTDEKTRVMTSGSRPVSPANRRTTPRANPWQRGWADAPE